jgi:hypothetical protein
MSVLGIPIEVTNELGIYSFLGLLALMILYLMKPKPVKKTIPSLIFLEFSSKKNNLASFFRNFVKDWLFVVQFFVVALLCLSILGITAELTFAELNKETVIVLDASASSKAVYEDKMLFDTYKDIAKKSLGLKNTIIMIKDSPQIVAKDTNPINAKRIINSLEPTDSLSNIWDSMMLASEFEKTNIVIISDFIDTNAKSIQTAKTLLEAKGNRVRLINPRTGTLDNVGIIRYDMTADKVTVEVKNFIDRPIQLTVKNTAEVIDLGAQEVKEFIVPLVPGTNEIEIETGDSFRTDDKLFIVLPKEAKTKVLFISNGKPNLYHALTSMKDLDVKKAEPPIIDFSDESLIVLSEVNYASLLPGTIETIEEKVRNGASLIIAAQKDIGISKLSGLLPVEIEKEKNEEQMIVNGGIEKFRQYNFGLSERTYQSSLINNNSLVIAKAYDFSPAIVHSKLGQGNVFFYGIFDSSNQFRLSTQYPIFWITSINLLLARSSAKELNLKVGEMIYGESIKSPSGDDRKGVMPIEEVGVYSLGQKKISSNLLSMEESDLNKDLKTETMDAEKKLSKQKVDMLPLFITLIILLMFLEIYIMKRRGDI